VIVGVGIDLLDCERFEQALSRTPEFARKMSEGQNHLVETSDLASTFAIMEALFKALPNQEKSEIANYKVRKTNGAYRIEDTRFAAVKKKSRCFHITLTNESKFTLAVVIIEEIKN